MIENIIADMINRIIQGDCRDIMKQMLDESVQCCITSPPYWGLRSYLPDKVQLRENLTQDELETLKKELTIKKDIPEHLQKYFEPAELGLEKTPEEYVEKMVLIFREVWRVLRKDGTLWLNLGDSYAGSGKGGQSEDKRSKNWQPEYPNKYNTPKNLKPKDLCGIPWRVALALQADGWWLRSDIIWHKPNPMPESVTDRPTKSHEYIFLMTKNNRYYYDADAIKEGTIVRRPTTFMGGNTYEHTPGKNKGKESVYQEELAETGRNKRSVWTVATHPFKEAHFATFPPKLIEPCILAGTSEKGCCPKCGAPWERIVERKRLTRPELPKDDIRYRPAIYHGAYADINGKGDAGYTEVKTIGWRPTCKCKVERPIPCIVLDPFVGSGTTAAVAAQYGRDYIVIDASSEYCQMTETRIKQATRQGRLI